MIIHYGGQFRDVCDIFYDAVYETASTVYSPEQLAAWAPLPRRYEAWKWRCALRRPYLYVEQGVVAAFVELEAHGHIDCLYTSPRYGRRGLASALLQHVAHTALQNRIPSLTTEASHVAKSVFEKNGFTVVRPNSVVRRGIDLTNWFMERPLLVGSQQS